MACIVKLATTDKAVGLLCNWRSQSL